MRCRGAAEAVLVARLRLGSASRRRSHRCPAGRLVAQAGFPRILDEEGVSGC
jgi:hypothetical protein